MRRLTILLLPIAVAACGGGANGGAGASPGGAQAPLSGSLEGRPFEVRGIIGKPMGTGVLVELFNRPATCGTPSAESMGGEHNFQVYVEGWPNLANGVRINLWNSPSAVNTAQTLPQGNGGSAQAMDGWIDLLNVGPAGGTIYVEARNDRGWIRGQIPFAICR
jgi:hypothetical protein